jgi:hypothetical protein
MRVFVGLGEGIGNVVMGLPLVDALAEAGHEVEVHLRPTPDSHEFTLELGALIGDGRPWIQWGSERAKEPYDAACLSHWWLSRGGPLPKARETFVGGPPSGEMPEILANLDAARTLAPDARQRAVLHVEPIEAITSRPYVIVHPGCKPDWKAAKVYPRWAEVVHRLKDLGAYVEIVGTPSDDAYCGEPHEDMRGEGLSLLKTAGWVAKCDVLVSGDSGIHHVAVALGIPTVALFHGSSVEKARHPDAAAPVTVMTSSGEFGLIDPVDIARAAIEVGWKRPAA